MALIKNRFKKSKFVMSMNVFALVAIILLSLVAGFVLSDSKMTGVVIFPNNVCGDMPQTLKELMNETNTWRNADIDCEKKLWAAQIINSQLEARLKGASSSDVQIVPVNKSTTVNNS